MSQTKKMLLLSLVMLIIVSMDVVGYVLIEGTNTSDALYMTVISITTVGYSEIFPLSTHGRLWTIWVIISGLGTVFYILGTLAESAFEHNIRSILGRRKMKMLKRMKDHVIVAGFGRMGENVCKELEKKHIKFLIIENDPERFAWAEEMEYNIINGDATSEEALEKAGIQKASTFVSLLSSDADNIFTIMAVREMNPDTCIISRALDGVNEKRMYKVGANRIVSPYDLGSRRIVNTVLRPHVVEFLDIMTYAPNMSLSIEELTVGPDSPFAGKQIKESGLREKYNIIIIGVKRKEETFFNPAPNLELKVEDILILVGEKEKLLSMN